MAVLKRVNQGLSSIGNMQVLYWLVSIGSGVAIGWLRRLDGYPVSQVALAALIAFAAVMVICSVGHRLVSRTLEAVRPERHKAVLHELADALSQLKASALTVGAWERNSPTPFQVQHSERHRETMMRVGQLIDQISYDRPTADTCKDFAQLCHFIVYDAIHKQDYSASRSELDRMSTGLFRYLHAGKSVNRSKIDLPDWIREQDEKARQRGQDRDRSSIRRTP